MADSQQQMALRKVSTSSTEPPQRKTSVEKKSVSFDQSSASATGLDRQNSQISERDEVFVENPVSKKSQEESIVTSV